VNSFGTEEVKLTFLPPLVFASLAERLIVRLDGPENPACAASFNFLCNHIEANPPMREGVQVK